LEEPLGVIETARRLVGLASKVRAARDPDFVLFRALDSESDALPVGEVRKYWSVTALEREDAKIAAFEENARRDACLAAGRLAERYAKALNSGQAVDRDVR
jgi:RPA family protein